MEIRAKTIDKKCKLIYNLNAFIALKIIIILSKGKKRKFDVKPYFKFKQLEELKEKEKFETVKVAGLSIEWENGADICPDELYNNSIEV